MKKYDQPVFVLEDLYLNKILTFGSIKALSDYLKLDYMTCYRKIKNGQYQDKFYKIYKTSLIRHAKK